MTIEVELLRAKLRAWLSPLLRTPLHPQWLIARRGPQKLAWVKEHCAGNTLDIGCADGSIAELLKSKCSYVGMDYPETAIKLYRTKPSVFADAAQLPFADHAFDTVLLLDTLEHVSRPEAAMFEASRVLKLNGTLLMTIPFAYPIHDAPHDFQRFTEFGLRSRAARAGLVVKEIFDIGGGVEAGALSICIALAEASIQVLNGRSWRMIFVPLIIVFVPIINVLGWLFSKALPESQIQPLAYYMRAEKQVVDTAKNYSLPETMN